MPHEEIYPCVRMAPLRDETPPANTILSIPVIRDLKRATWYYGVRCACKRLLALCEDCFSGKGNEDRLPMPGMVAVKCECGSVTNTQLLQKFKTPGLQ